MKKLFIIFFVTLFTNTMMLSSQTQQHSSDNIFVKTTRVTNITPHDKGYIVSYIKDSGKVGHALMPIEWFTPGAAVKATLLLTDSSAYPAISLFYSDGRISRIKLYAMKRPADLTWGRVSRDSSLDEQFMSVKENPTFVF